MTEFEHNTAALTSFPKPDIWAYEANTTCIFGNHKYTQKKKKKQEAYSQSSEYSISTVTLGYMHIYTGYSNYYHFAKFINTRYILKEHGMSLSSTDRLLIFCKEYKKWNTLKNTVFWDFPGENTIFLWEYAPSDLVY